MPGARMAFDRYHATMGNFSMTRHAAIGDPLAWRRARFYVTQRKLPFAPCVGHERLLESLVAKNLDIPRLRFLREDKAGLHLIAEELARATLPFEIRAVRPGTIVFPQEPIADIAGPFAETQMAEVWFEHAFDEPMTVAGNALAMRFEAGERWLSDFSLRRDGGLDRACEIAKYAYIGGFNDTSNMEAAFLLDLNPVGTMAHYLVQAFHGFLAASQASGKEYPEKDELGRKKHFEQVAFERWLDAHPSGTTLLLDTVSLRLGTIHAIRAAKSSEKRRAALKAVRIDSGDLIKNALWVQRMLDVNALQGVKIILTSDLNVKAIREIVSACPFVYGFGVGTKLAAEVEHIAGVIFKLCEISGEPTAKCSETPGKETSPGALQVWRYADQDGFFVKDVIGLQHEQTERGAIPLLVSFWGFDRGVQIPSPKEQREFVLWQLKHFRDIRNYPVEMSPELTALRQRIVKAMKEDEAGEDDVCVVEYPVP